MNKLNSNTIYAETVSGDIEITSLEGESSFDSVSGNISIYSFDLLKDFYSSTVSGNVKIFVPQNVPFQLTFDTLSGNKYTPKDVNSGGSKIEVVTTSGNLSIDYVNEE